MNDFILSNDKTLPAESFNEANLLVLQNILNTAWINNPEEADYFTSEFEMRIQNSSK